MKARRELLLILVLTIGNQFTCKSQTLFGDWIELQDQNHYNFPKVDIIEFSKDSAIYYNFKEIVFKKKISDFVKYESDKAILENDSTLYEYFIFLDSNKLILKSLYKKHIGPKIKKVIISKQYIRLKSTQISTSPEDVVKSTYVIRNGHKIVKLIFDEKFSDTEIFEYGDNVMGNICYLEKRKQAYFVSVYIDNDRIKIIPIKEMSPEQLILYGLDGIREIKAVKIKDGRVRGL